MVQKLSTFLSTSLTEASLDSAGVRAIVQSETILLDSGTSGNYVKDITGGPGITVSGSGAHTASVSLAIDSDHLATRTGVQTLTNKTINLTNNTLSMTLTQLNNAISGGLSVASLTGTETLTNKTLTTPTINSPTITGPTSITDVSTFGLRDVTTTAYETRILSNNISPALTADRTLTIDVNNADRTVSLTGNLTLGGSLTTSGSHNTTLTTSGTTSLTLPTSGTVITKDGSENFAITGTMTGNVDRSSFTTVDSGTYGSSQTIPIITVNSSGFVDSIGFVNVSGTTGATFDSSNGVFTISTTGGDYSTRISLGAFSTDSLDEGSINLYFTDARARAAISVTDAGGDGSLGYVEGTGVITYTGPSASEVRAHFSEGTNISISSGQISTSATPSFTSLTLSQTTGTAPMTISSTTMVSNLNAQYLGGNDSDYYRINVYDATGTLLN